MPNLKPEHGFEDLEETELSFPENPDEVVYDDEGDRPCGDNRPSNKWVILVT